MCGDVCACVAGERVVEARMWECVCVCLWGGGVAVRVYVTSAFSVNGGVVVGGVDGIGMCGWVSGERVVEA